MLWSFILNQNWNCSSSNCHFKRDVTNLIIHKSISYSVVLYPSATASTCTIVNELVHSTLLPSITHFLSATHRFSLHLPTF